MEPRHNKSECAAAMLPVQDALTVLHGRWKLPIIVALRHGKKRFREIAREVEGITDKVLSKELKEMEMNQLVTRKVYDTFPPSVEYEITAHGESLGDVLSSLHKWGTSHRKKIMGKK